MLVYNESGAYERTLPIVADDNILKMTYLALKDRYLHPTAVKHAHSRLPDSPARLCGALLIYEPIRRSKMTPTSNNRYVQDTPQMETVSLTK